MAPACFKCSLLVQLRLRDCSYNFSCPFSLRGPACVVNAALQPLKLLEGGGLCSLWEIKGASQDHRAVILTDEEQLAFRFAFSFIPSLYVIRRIMKMTSTGAATQCS